MRPFIAAVCVLVGLIALLSYRGTDPAPDDAMGHLAYDVYYDRCQPTVWITGVIVKGSQLPNRSIPPGVVDMSTGIQDDNGVFYDLVWGGTNNARVEYGKRYKLGGAWFGNPGGSLWTCAGPEAVIPQ